MKVKAENIKLNEFKVEEIYYYLSIYFMLIFLNIYVIASRVNFVHDTMFFKTIVWNGLLSLTVVSTEITSKCWQS